MINNYDVTDIFQSFKSLTGVSFDETAQHWLEVSNYDLQTALELYFSSQQPHNELPVDTSTPQYHSGEGSSDYLEDSSDNVRIPDQIKRTKLVHDNFTVDNDKLVKRARKGIFVSGRDSIPKTEKEKTLANLFKPPTEITTNLDFDETKELGCSEHKWILVNIQCDSEFGCHILNRDLWNDDIVKDLIHQSFAFWQQLNASQDGLKFIANYKVQEFPYIAIINPLTGALAWTISGKRAVPERVRDQLMDFLNINPDPIAALGDDSKAVSSVTSQSASSSSNRSETFLEPIHREVEEQQEENDSKNDHTVVSRQQGFPIQQILNFSNGSVKDKTGSTTVVSIKLKMPAKESIVVKLNSSDSLISLLQTICIKFGLQTSQQRLEISFGYPLTIIPEESITDSVYNQTLNDIGLHGSILLNVRINE